MAAHRTQEVHLVTGGGGYSGYKLGLALLEEGYKVILFDLNEPKDGVPEGITFIKGNVCDFDSLREAFAGVDCVYHLASYGMSGREQLNTKLIEAVNVQGSKNVVQACLNSGVIRLVYASTYNSVFVDQKIENGKEDELQYAPLHKYLEPYSRTKAIAERYILESDGKALQVVDSNRSEHDVLRTCALRLAGVYGPGEQRHVPRTKANIECNMVLVTYGGADARQDFLHIDNLTQAHIKAASALGPKHGYIAGGQAYFISDNKPINTFQFFKPLIEACGKSFPTVDVPLSVIYFIAFCIEIVHGIIGRFYNFQPLITRAEVLKSGVTHTFSIEKAHAHFNYTPTIQNDMQGCIKWYQDRGELLNKGNLRCFKKAYGLKRFIVDVFLVIIAVAIVMSFIPTTE